MHSIDSATGRDSIERCPRLGRRRRNNLHERVFARETVFIHRVIFQVCSLLTLCFTLYKALIRLNSYVRFETLTEIQLNVLKSI